MVSDLLQLPLKINKVSVRDSHFVIIRTNAIDELTKFKGGYGSPTSIRATAQARRSPTAIRCGECERRTTNSEGLSCG
jgi:hypothetical protein